MKLSICSIIQAARYAMILVSLFSVSLAFAGNEGSGGGDAVLRDQKWSLLDLAEKLPYDFYIPQNETYFPKVSAALTALSHLCPGFMAGNVSNFAGVYPRDLPGNLFGEPLIFAMTNSPLEEIPDEGVIGLPTYDLKRQLAVQKEGVVMISRPLFTQLDDVNKAGLIIHEAILRYLIEVNPNLLKKSGTAPIRTLVRYIFSKPGTVPQAAFEQLCGVNGILHAGSGVNWNARY